MNTGNEYGFQQLVDLCKQTHQQIPQTMSAKFRENEVSQQSADPLPGFCINPAESDKILMQFRREEHT